MTIATQTVKHAARLAALALALSAGASAQDKAAEKADVLTIGSPAPVPAIEKFVRGTEPKWFDPGKVYVVEFWATWCGPCRMSMPHISDVADKYKDKVVVVGISDEKVDTVTKFLDTDEWKQKARYNLATDPDRSVHKAYMEAAGQNGIPTAFVVKDSKVQWIGHPMSMDEPLAKIVDGSWDATAYKAEFEQQAAMERKAMQRRRAMAKARQSGDWDSIMRMIDEDIAAAPAKSKPAMQVSKFKLLLTDANKPADGYALGREIVAAAKDDKMVLNEVAWFVLDEDKVKERDIPFALETAKAAATASGGEGGRSTGGWVIPDENDRTDRRSPAIGRLVMAKLPAGDSPVKPAQNSSGCQFTILTGPAESLDGFYTVFGRVIEGLEHVQALREGDQIVRATVISKRAKDYKGVRLGKGAGGVYSMPRPGVPLTPAQSGDAGF